MPEAIHYFLGIGYIEIYQINNNVKAAVAINNLFDKKYYEYYLMPGRNAAIELSASF